MNTNSHRYVVGKICASDGDDTKKMMRRHWRAMGRNFTLGAFEAFAYLIFVCVALALVHPPDSTDRGWWHRSGLTIYTDTATGIQYVGHGSALTPRLDTEGKPLLNHEH